MIAIRFELENEPDGPPWTFYWRHGIQKVRGSTPLGSTNVMSQDIVDICCKTLCTGQRPPRGW